MADDQPTRTPGGGGARAAVVAAALVALLAVVAVSTVARRPVSGATAREREIAPAFWDYLLSTLLAAWLLLVPVTIYLVWARAGWRRDPNAGRRRDLAVLAVFAVLVLLALLVGRFRPVDGRETVTRGGQPDASAVTTPGERADRSPELRLAPFVIAGVGLVLAVAALGYHRRRRRPLGEGDESVLAEELELLVADALDDLRAEPDPRRAVIAAYARMERALRAFGLARVEAEAPLEYLERIAPDVAHVPGASRLAFELTHLYERARFSAHEVDVGMKTDAITALELLRAELQEWAA